jgi:formate dehydrogenase
LAPEEIAPLAPHVLEQSFEQERSGATAGLRLIPKREAHTHNSWMHNVPGLVRGRRGRAHLFMHPEDAWARGLEQGSQARVRSATGSVEVPLRLTDEVMPGTVALPHGWGHAGTPGLSVASQLEGPNSNRLAAADPSALERFTGMTQLTGIPVEVEGSGPSTGHT